MVRESLMGGPLLAGPLASKSGLIPACVARRLWGESFQTFYTAYFHIAAVLCKRQKAAIGILQLLTVR